MKQFMMKIIINTLLVVSLCSLSYSLPEDSNLPIQITSDSGGYDHQIKEGFYESNVVMTQGTLEIKADYAKFIMVDDELDYVVANGQLIKIKYLPEKDKPWVFGEGEILEYFPKKNLLILKNKAKIEQGTDIAEANRLEYNTVEQKVKALSENKQDRVFFEIKPKGK